MKIKNYLLTAVLITLLSSCASGGISSGQKRELAEARALYPEVYVEEKNVVAATALGLVFGGGSFYTGHPVSGVFNLLLWPLSIFWDPINGYEGALEANYYATKINYKKMKAAGKIKDDLF
jgi:hypothetical protein